MTQLTRSLIDCYTELSAHNLMNHVRRLAADDMRGRMPGDIGYKRAMDYVITSFRNNGVSPAFEDLKYEQKFSLETCRILKSSVSLSLGTESEKELILGRDYVCRGLTGDGTISGDLVFIGYCSTDSDFNELDSVDINGKIAVSFKHPAPGKEVLLPREKAHLLKKRGAIGLIIVPNPNRSDPDRLSVSLVEKGEYIPGFPLLVVAEHIADLLFNFNEKTLSSRQFNIDEFHDVMSESIPARMKINVKTEYCSEGKSWNIAGIIKGCDPDLAHETVIVGAHLDHVGIQGEKVIFNGAQDNASGVAAVLEMARVFAMGPKSRRSIIFALFGAEEAGLIGSLHYIGNSPCSLDNTVAMANLDCIGAGSGVDMRGRKSYPELFKVFDEVNSKYVRMPDTNADNPSGGADAQPFEDAKIPNMYFVAKDAYKHLHMASDIPETLNPTLLEGITRLAYLTLAELTQK